MLNLITILCLFNIILFPSLMLIIVYPFSKKAALFWSNYVTKHSSRVFFAVLKLYRKFGFEQDFTNYDKLPENFIIISNHQSLLDVVCFLNFFHQKDLRFIAKDSLKTSPMVGQMLKSQQHCMIPRKGNLTYAIKEITAFGKRCVKLNQCPLIFPEGTRSRTGELGKFHSAGFRTLCEASGLPVVVCCLDGGYKLSTLKQIVTKMYKGTYRVKILKIYDNPKTKEEQQHILDESSEMMKEQLKIWRKN